MKDERFSSEPNPHPYTMLAAKFGVVQYNVVKKVDAFIKLRPLRGMFHYGFASPRDYILQRLV